MQYISVMYEEKAGKHVLHVDVDGAKREIAFPVKWQAMELMRRLQVYCRLSDCLKSEMNAA